MKLHKTITLTLINSLLLSSLALAEPQFDLDKEKRELSNRVFNNYDINNNKTLSFEEFTSFTKEMKEKEHNKRVERTIKSCDKNGNEKIELSEIPTEKEMEEMYTKNYQDMEKMCHMDKMQFNRINKDEDDFITKDEILLSYNQSHFGIRDDTSFEMPKRDKLKEFKERLERCDKNKDREITLIEATSDMCYLSSEVFLEYSLDPEKSFTIDNVTKAPNENEGMQLEHRFKGCDRNNDEKLTLVEATSLFCNMPSNEFIKLDTDNSQYLLKSEMKKMYDEELHETNKVPTEIFKKMPPIIQISMALNQCDEDKDRTLTRDEAETCDLSMKTFEKFDSDKSNTIDENDMKMMQTVEEFNMVDRNNNKEIDEKEFEERMGNRYEVF